MALPYTHTGTFTRSAGLFAAIAKQAKLLNLKPAKKIEFAFDPFGEDVVSLRNTLSFFHQERVRDSNPKCNIKSTVLCDRSEPTIKVTLASGHKLLFKTSNLQTLEILKKFNELVSSQVEAEEAPSVGVTTKGASKRR